MGIALEALMPRPSTLVLTVLASAALALPARTVAQAAGPSPGSPGAPLSALRWRTVGPYIGGRVVAVTGVRGNPNLFYMGAVDGGVWKSTDYGIKWTNISDSTLPGTSHSIGAIAVAPSDPSILYVGTGESDIRGDLISGDGVFRSADAGKTWSRAGLEETHTISKLVVDPKNPDVVYASSLGHVFVPEPQRGVFKTTDGGRTWQRVLFVNDSSGAVDLVMDPQEPNVLYAAMWQAYRTPWKLSSGGAGSGLYKTTDAGAHWTNISRHPGLPTGLLGKIGVAVAGSAPNVVYAIIQAAGGGVFRSDDAGGTWRRVNDEWKLRQRAFYYMAIFADPKDPNTVYAPEVDGLFVSHDGAKTFTRLRTPHGDNHVLWINPDDPGILLEGNDGGATVSTDSGKTWSTEHNQPTGQFYHVDLDGQFPFHMYGAQQDEGAFQGPSATSQGAVPLAAWKRSAYGESTPSVPDRDHPGVTYGSGYYSIFLEQDDRTEEYRSVSPWPNYQEGASAGELKYRFAWTHPILFSPAKPDELFVGSQYVMESGDRGRTWRTISPDLTRNDPATEGPSGGPIDLDQSGAELYPYVSAIGVSPRDGDVIWAGSSDGLVHVTTDGGRQWQPVTVPGLPAWSDITTIEPSHVDRATAYLTAWRYMWDDYAPYVFKTTDLGAHWTPISQGVARDDYVMAIRQDPDDKDLLFLATKRTVYVSLDGGGEWRPLALNLPPVQVRDVAIDTRQGCVVIATHGRAFWVLDNLALLEQMTRRAAPPPDSAALFAPQRAWLTHAYGKSAGPQPVDAGENPPFGATVFFRIPASYDGRTPVTLAFSDAAGRPIRRFELHLKSKAPAKPKAVVDEEPPSQRKLEADSALTAIEPGMNHFQWNLRYPDATEVTGFEPPIAAGGLEDEVVGPVVIPGDYRVTLTYGGQTVQQSFAVALDPRIEATPEALGRRLALGLQIHETLDSLDRTINRALAVRDSLAAAHRAPAVVSALDSIAHGLVELDLHSSEGDLLHETELRSHLAYLAAEVDLAYAAPTAAQAAVFVELERQAHAGEERLRAALAKMGRGASSGR
ncbi:MAG TPA: glycosyl hydrolase [Gemmatimonadales bacterium]|nr:glycosyl hydrolase [Gemmatimonadales bacterium]